MRLHVAADVYNIMSMLMRQKITYWIEYLTGCILSLLGFSACNGEGWGSMPVEYGCPNADYKVIGTVTDKSGNPLKGIQVESEETIKGSQEPLKSTALTDAEGKFTILSGNSFPMDRTLDVVFTDIDGPENGGDFETESVKGAVYKQTKDGDHHWYEGEFTADVSVALKKKASK